MGKRGKYENRGTEKWEGAEEVHHKLKFGFLIWCALRNIPVQIPLQSMYDRSQGKCHLSIDV